MKQLNILVTRSLKEELLHQITAVSPQIKLLNGSDLSAAELGGDFTGSERLATMLAQTEVIYGFWPPPNVIARAPRLKWIHTMLAGVDHPVYADIFKSSVVVTNSKGLHTAPVSEMALEMMLMLVKRATFCLQLKQEKKWQRFVPELLQSQTVGIVGMGSIGKGIARLAKAFGMRVIATRRSVKRVTRARHVDMLLPGERLTDLLSESDFVVLTLPSTPETSNLIGEKELRAMKPTAYLINVGRGCTVDEDALVRALDEKWIAGAGLDTFVSEPLPVESKLWELPNVIFSPHVAGVSKGEDFVATKFFCENLRRYLDGKKLLNVVKKKRGY